MEHHQTSKDVAKPVLLWAIAISRSGNGNGSIICVHWTSQINQVQATKLASGAGRKTKNPNIANNTQGPHHY